VELVVECVECLLAEQNHDPRSASLSAQLRLGSYPIQLGRGGGDRDHLAFTWALEAAQCSGVVSLDAAQRPAWVLRLQLGPHK
jgi:hypothetical protein